MTHFLQLTLPISKPIAVVGGFWDWVLVLDTEAYGLLPSFRLLSLVQQIFLDFPVFLVSFLLSLSVYQSLPLTVPSLFPVVLLPCLWDVMLTTS